MPNKFLRFAIILHKPYNCSIITVNRKTFKPASDLYCWIIIIVFFGLVLHAPFSVFSSSLFPDLSLLFKSWKEILLLVCLLIGVYLCIKKGLTVSVLGTPIIRLILVYVLINLLCGLFSANILSFLSGLLINLRFLLFFVLVYFAAKIRPDFVLRFYRAALIGASIVLVFGLLQVLVLPADILSHIGYGPDTIQAFQTIDQNPDFIRINSTLRGPNPLGAYAIMPFIFGLYLAFKRPSSRRQLALALFLLIGSSVCLFASFSRSALLGALLSSIIYLIFRFRSHLKIILISAAVLCLTGISMIFIFRNTDFIKNVVFHRNDESSSIEKSDDEHIESLEESITSVLLNPLGHGTGSTNSASYFSDQSVVVENYFLAVAYELGFLGLIVFIVIIILIFKGSLRGQSPQMPPLLCAGLGVIITCLFLPTLVDETVSMTFFGLLGIIYLYEANQKTINLNRLHSRLHTGKPNQP